MKSKNVTTALFTLCCALSISTSAYAGDMKRNVYLASCQYSAPLYTYENCSEYSSIGRIAADCAMNDALDQCQSDLNSDCVSVSVKVWPESSLEFIGYKKCAAKARVHGYEKQ